MTTTAASEGQDISPPDWMTTSDVIRYLRLDSLGAKDPHHTFARLRSMNPTALPRMRLSNGYVYPRESVVQFARSEFNRQQGSEKHT